MVKRLGEALSEIAPIQELDVAVAFIREGGPEILKTVLAEKCRVRVLVGLYLGSIDPRALKRLLDMGVEVKVYTNSTFHPKVYLVHRAEKLKEGEVLAVVGSANLSRAGLVENIELSVALRGSPNSPVLKEIASYFEELWHSPCSKPLDDKLLGEFERYWRPVRSATRKAKVKETLEPILTGRNAVWLAVTSPKNYEICSEKRLWGVERAVRLIKEVKPGDLIIFYVKREKKVRDVWIVETEAFEDRRRVWPDKVYPYRVNIHQLFKGSANIEELASTLNFIKNVSIWGSYLQREMVRLCSEDAKILVTAIIGSN